MLRGSDIMKRSVIAQDTGERVGRVEDLVIDRAGRRVLGIVVAEKTLIGSDKVVAWPAIRSLGMDNIIIDSTASVLKKSEIPELAEAMDDGYVILGSRLQTTGGRELGKIDSFFFDPETGEVVGFELTGGPNKLRESGSSFLPTPPNLQVGKDYSFVDPSAVETIEDMGMALRRRGTPAKV